MPRPSEQPSAVCLASMLAVGTGIVLLFLMLIIGGSISSAVKNRHRGDYFSEAIDVTQEGQPIIRHYDHVSPSGNFEMDLDRNRIARPPDVQWIPSMPVANLPFESRASPMFLASRGRSIQVLPMTSGAEDWFFVWNGETQAVGYFEGYDSKQLQRIGYIGVLGFQESKPNLDHQFTFDGQSLSMGYLESSQVLARGRNRAFLLQNDATVLHIDFEKRVVSPLIEGAICLGALSSYTGNETVLKLVMRTANSVEEFNDRAEFIDRFPIPSELQEAQLRFFHYEDSVVLDADVTDYVDLNSEELSNAVSERPHVVVLYGTDSRVESTTPITLRSSTNMSVIDTNFATVAVPSIVWGFGIILPMMLMSRDIPGTYAHNASTEDVLWGTLTTIAPALLIVVLLSIFLAWLTLRHHRRVGERGTWMWTVFVFFTGLPGFVGYRLHRRWPHVEPTAEIELTGTEIFA
ncbi:MAG: hypothetical protein KDA93_13970 [Planctomycetaceae bacterium]|nr:hypothetical protein [Planctomycetaceae bacterium]